MGKSDLEAETSFVQIDGEAIDYDGRKSDDSGIWTNLDDEESVSEECDGVQEVTKPRVSTTDLRERFASIFGDIDSIFARPKLREEERRRKCAELAALRAARLKITDVGGELFKERMEEISKRAMDILKQPKVAPRPKFPRTELAELKKRQEAMVTILKEFCETKFECLGGYDEPEPVINLSV